VQWARDHFRTLRTSEGGGLPGTGGGGGGGGGGAQEDGGGQEGGGRTFLDPDIDASIPMVQERDPPIQNKI
jgi:hypothetical protein